MKINWLYHFIELIIVIIGISIAFWLNNMAAENREEKLKKVFMQEIKEELHIDLLLLKKITDLNSQKLKSMEEGLNLIEERAQPERILPYIFELGNYNFFFPEDMTIRSLLQSGDFKTIDSREVKKELLRLIRFHDSISESQENFLSALDLNYFPILVESVDMTSGELDNQEFVYELRIKNYFGFTINETSNIIPVYEALEKQTQKVIGLIDRAVAE